MQTRTEKETEKYTAIWDVPRYADYSPGEQYAPVFAEIEPNKDATIVDIGCGAGAGGKALRGLGYEDMTYLDLVPVTKEHPFFQTAIWDDWGTRRWKKKKAWLEKAFDWGYCCDVLEHVPTEYVGLALHRIKENCDQVFLSIGLDDDAFGALIRDQLHLTIRPFIWWRDLLSEYGEVKSARDLHVTGMFHVKF